MDTNQSQPLKEKEIKQTQAKEDLNDEPFEFSDRGGENPEDDKFDAIIGAIQEIVISPEFEEHQRKFFEKNNLSFEDADEGKAEYATIFKDYQTQLESLIEKKLKQSHGIDMKNFLKDIKSRVDETDPQLFDLLLSFTDFQQFKENMLESKNKSNDLAISGQSKLIHKEGLKKKGKAPENVEDKENLNLNLEKEAQSGKGEKKGATKATPEYSQSQPQKESIFS